MKQLSLILSIVAVLLSGTLLVMQLKGKTASPAGAAASKGSVREAGRFTIAYFDTDSMQNNYAYFKDALSGLKEKEEKMNEQLRAMERNKQKKIAEWQTKIKNSNSNISQAEGESMEREYRQLEENNAYTRQKLQQDLEMHRDEELMKVRKKIEEYLKEYNSDKKYSFIFSYVPNFMFYKDTLYDITPEIIDGLNTKYKQEVKAK
jgi:outer membrane protein